jgi:hypothetical protein
MLEPEEPPVCKCKYDEARDVMDREDCFFHCDIEQEALLLEELLLEYQPREPQTGVKKPAAIVKQEKENAA